MSDYFFLHFKVLLQFYLVKLAERNSVNSVSPDQMAHFTVSDLGQSTLCLSFMGLKNLR